MHSQTMPIWFLVLGGRGIPRQPLYILFSRAVHLHFNGRLIPSFITVDHFVIGLVSTRIISFPAVHSLLLSEAAVHFG